MTLEISEIVLAKSFLVLGLLAFACIGFASLVNLLMDPLMLFHGR